METINMKEKVNKYQLVTQEINQNTAGSKAPNDIEKIADKMGFRREEIIREVKCNSFFSKVRRQIHYYSRWREIYSQINNNSIVLVQYPFKYHELNRKRTLEKLKNRKNVKLIFLVHDVESLRGAPSNHFYKSEFLLMLSLADQIIVHNLMMKKFFIDKGVPEDKLVNLKIFDYLIDNYQYHFPTFSKTILIAGNLNAEKTKYIKYLDKLHIHFELYGPGYNGNSTKYINYNGVMSPDDIYSVLNRGFGLVWDGNSTSTCNGKNGNYLRYNDPHKLSLYLASGIPVIIWKEAAEAKFVEENKVGITVDSLEELPEIFKSLDSYQYEIFVKNVKKIAEKLINGQYTIDAMNTAYQRINKE
jgi:hypothetical protein